MLSADSAVRRNRFFVPQSAFGYEPKTQTCTAVFDGWPQPRGPISTAFDRKSQQGSNQMPSIVAAGAGVHVNESERLIAHDFQDVGVAADEQARPQPTDFLPGTPVVIAWIPADVRHVDFDALALPDEIASQVGAEFLPVDVPVNSPDRFERPETIQYVRRPEVSRVPHFITLGKVMENSGRATWKCGIVWFFFLWQLS
jgi:hypothetical protein